MSLFDQDGGVPVMEPIEDMNPQTEDSSREWTPNNFKDLFMRLLDQGYVRYDHEREGETRHNLAHQRGESIETYMTRVFSNSIINNDNLPGIEEPEQIKPFIRACIKDAANRFPELSNLRTKTIHIWGF